MASLELECVLDIVDFEASKYSGKGQKAPFFAMSKKKKKKSFFCVGKSFKRQQSTEDFMVMISCARLSLTCPSYRFLSDETQTFDREGSG